MASLILTNLKLINFVLNPLNHDAFPSITSLKNLKKPRILSLTRGFNLEVDIS